MADINSTENNIPLVKDRGAEKFSQFVVFVLDNEEYAVSIADLQEIIKVPDITPIPNAPKFIKGILNLRGKIVVIIDLEERFGLVREKVVALKHIIVTEINGTNFGVAVDEVVEVLTVPEKIIQSTPTLVSSKIHNDYLKGVVVLNDTKEEQIVKPAKISQDVLDETTATDYGDESTINNPRLLVLIDLSKILQEEELMEVTNTVSKTVE